MSSCLDDLFSYQRAQCVTSSINATGTWDNPGRSWLFVPGNRDRMIAKAASVGADVVMFDLEDSVPPEEKANALGKVSRYLATQPTSSTRGDTKPAAFVRVNRSEGEGLAAQLGPLVRVGLVGVCIPKVESPIDVATVSDMLSEFEVRASLPAGSVWVQPIIETALGLLHAEQIAGCDTRVWHSPSGPRILRSIWGSTGWTRLLNWTRRGGMFRSRREQPGSWRLTACTRGSTTSGVSSRRPPGPNRWDIRANR